MNTPNDSPPLPAPDGSGRSHPWRNAGWKFMKLKEARKEAKRRYERGDMHKEAALDSSRRRRNIPPDLPKMHSWDYVKGRVPNTTPSGGRE